MLAKRGAKLAVGLGLVAMAVGCRQLPAELDGHLDRRLLGAGNVAHDAEPERSSESPAALEEKIAAARALAQQDDLDAAIEAYREIVQHHPIPARVYQQLAVLYDRNGQSDKSARYYLAGLRLAPEDAELLCDYGYSRCVHGDLVVAEQALRRALAADPNLARAHNNLGLVLAHSGRHDEAVAAFSRAGCSPNEARANLAYALIAGGDWDAADEQLKFAERPGAAAE